MRRKQSIQELIREFEVINNIIDDLENQIETLKTQRAAFVIDSNRIYRLIEEQNALH